MSSRVFQGLVVAGALAVAGCGGGGGSDTTPLGGSASLAIGDAAGANASLPPPNTMVVVGYEGSQAGVLGYGPPDNGFQAKLWQVLIGFGSAVGGGQTFTITAPPAPGTDTTGLAVVSFEDDTSGGFSEWDANGGTVKVDTLVGDTAALTLDATGFQPSKGGSGNGATGTFTLTGKITVADINQAFPAD